MDLLAVTETLDGETLQLGLRGELDRSTAHILEAALARAGEHRGPVYLDIAELGFMDSTGLRMFLEANKEFGGRLAISWGTRTVMRVFEVTNCVDSLPFDR